MRTPTPLPKAIFLKNSAEICNNSANNRTKQRMNMNQIEKIPAKRVYCTDAVLSVVDAGLWCGDRWHFMYRGFKITAKLGDKSQEKELNRDTLRRGDAIKVRLEITQKYVSDYHAYENKSYRVAEFYGRVQSHTKQIAR